MPWTQVSVMDQRLEFVRLALVEGVNRRELCRRFGISAETGYKWLRRHRVGEGLADRSRRPLTSPGRSGEAVEALIVAMRQAHPAWGGARSRPALPGAGRRCRRCRRCMPCWYATL